MEKRVFNARRKIIFDKATNVYLEIKNNLPFGLQVRGFLSDNIELIRDSGRIILPENPLAAMMMLVMVKAVGSLPLVMVANDQDDGFIGLKLNYFKKAGKDLRASLSAGEPLPGITVIDGGMGISAEQIRRIGAALEEQDIRVLKLGLDDIGSSFDLKGLTQKFLSSGLTLADLYHPERLIFGLARSSQFSILTYGLLYGLTNAWPRVIRMEGGEVLEILDPVRMPAAIEERR